MARTLFVNIDVINLVGELSLRETVALMRKAILYIGNDTGVMYIASACGVRIVEISAHIVGGDDNGWYSTERFHPWGVEYTILQPKMIHEDINSILVDDVIEAVNYLVFEKYIIN